MTYSPVTTGTQDDAPEPFPSLSDASPHQIHLNANTEPTDPNRTRNQSAASSFQSRIRSASKTFQESSPPAGFSIAVGQAATSIPSLASIRRGSFGSDYWSGEGQVREKERRASLRRGSSGEEIPRRRSSATPNSPIEHSAQDFIPESVPEAPNESEQQTLSVITSGKPMSSGEPSSLRKDLEDEKPKEASGGPYRSSDETNPTSKIEAEYRTTPFDNGYQFPPKHTWMESFVTGSKAFWKFSITPIGFFVVIYGCNVVAWGGMLFLLLCNASPAMCKPTCNDINSPRRIWIEIDSQILTALFCVTGFGTIPWRFRDLYYLMQYRIQKKQIGLRRLAGINRGWFRLPGSQDLPVELGPSEIEAGAEVPESSIAFPVSKTSDAPLTGIRAPPTAMWKLDFVVWSMIWNTIFQAILCGLMWGFNRYRRPSWSTGLFVCLGCGVAIAGGIMSFIEGKHVKAVEGVRVSEADQERLRRDRELGITHWNNINDEAPKQKKEKAGKSGLFMRKQKATDVDIEGAAGLQEGAGQLVR